MQLTKIQMNLEILNVLIREELSGKIFSESLQRLNAMLKQLPENEVNETNKENERNKIIQGLEEQVLQALENSEIGKCYIIPSKLGNYNFSFLVKELGKVTKRFGKVSEGGFELTGYDKSAAPIKAESLEECINQVLLTFEMQGVIPVVVEEHRRLVLAASQEIIKSAVQNNNLNKLTFLFEEFSIHELEGAILLSACDKSQKPIIDFLLDKITHNKIKINDTEGKDWKAELLGIAKKRAQRDDAYNLSIAHALHHFLGSMSENGQRKKASP
jgi:hypothetical protein